MRRSLLLLLPFVLSLFASAQENRVITVGVPLMVNQAGRSVPPAVERDRLIQAFNDLKPDKKTGIKVRAVALGGATGDEISDEAAQKKCDYVVYTALTELRTGTDPYQRRPGTIETNPDSQWGSRSPEGQAMDPEYRATVEYKLYSLGAHSMISGAPFSTQGGPNEIVTVGQIMDRIANKVFAEVKKGSPPPMRE